MGQTPTIGRIVHYKLSGADVLSVNDKRLKDQTSGNAARKGDVFPALIVRTWGEQEGASVQLQVFLDGPDTYWATSRTEGDGEGQYIWPPRV
jgi:hypothetical protein